MALAAALLSGACAPVYLSRVDVREVEASTVRERDMAAVGEREAPARDRETPPSSETAETGSLAAVLGTLVWPLAVERSSVLSSPYGVRRHPVDGGSRFHTGLDLRAPAGTPVYAAAEGRVIRSGASGAYGNVVVIDHGAGLTSLYGHHRENLVRKGERVRRGQVIALVGRTGNATGDHLHFELRWRDGTVDPRVVLPRLGGAAD